jgi:hypothetical protein
METGVRLTVVGSQGEADVICSLLRANGIDGGDRHAPEMLGSFTDPWGGPPRSSSASTTLTSLAR